MSQANRKLTQEINTELAEKALKSHAEACGMDYEPSHEAVVDILTNLRHYCDAHDLSYRKADKMAHSHYLAEVWS